MQSGFDEFREGVRRICKVGHRNRINLNASPYFATRYLVDRLDRFRDRLPGADIRLKTMVELPDFSADEVDAAIQWGFGQWRDYESTLLVQDPKVICCSPARGLGPAQSAGPQDRTAAPSGAGNEPLAACVAPSRRGSGEVQKEIQFHDAASMRRATLSGLGIGLISVLDAQEDLKAGRLSRPSALMRWRAWTRPTCRAFTRAAALQSTAQERRGVLRVDPVEDWSRMEPDAPFRGGDLRVTARR